ncbi:MAG: helicase-related protein [bacterium]
MINEGDIIKGSLFKEPVKIEKIQNLDFGIHIIGYTINSKQYIDKILDDQDLKKIQVIKDIIDFSFNPELAFLVIEANRFRYAALFDPLLAVNVSKIDPLPFQIDAVYGYILNQPKVRFMIADDPGAGKTIMAGLIIKELKLRRLVNRVLVVVPGHLKDQWRRELKEKFQENFYVIDRDTLNAHYGTNPWEEYNNIITSIDFAKQDDILNTLKYVHWDLVVVDEAHKMSAYNYLGKITKTQRYKLGEILSNTSTHLVFLTATPHRGDPESFRLFLDLLIPGFFANNKLLEESIKNKENTLFIRRLKEDLRDFEGKPIFTRRFPKTNKYHLLDEEKELYNEVSRYIMNQYNSAIELKNKMENIAFALGILQRRMASSTYALLKSLQRRKEKLEKILNNLEIPIDKQNLSFINYEYIQELEDYEEQKRWEKEELLESITLAKNPQELKQEIEILSNLIQKAKKIIENTKEKKLQELKIAIDEGFQKIKEINGNPKILIFTEFKDTLDYLVEKISSWGYKVNFIHGGMNIEERIKQEKIFRDETEIMVATEAAGEGINLQFCHIMINYDIPWNPNRLEQRMGRIHRYGQQKDVYIFNLVAEDTIEGKVFSKLFEKLEEIKNQLGSDKVFDIIGEIFEGRNLYQLIIDAVTNAKTMDQILQELDIKPDYNYISKIRDMLAESLATRSIDYTRIKEISQKAKEYRLIPEYLEEFFKKAFEKAGGKFRKLKNQLISIDSIPYELRKISENMDFKNRYGNILKSYPKATFDKDIAFKNPDIEFISFGHPLFEALLEWIFNNFSQEIRKGTVFIDPTGNLDGYILFFIAEIKDGNNEIAGKKILCFYYNNNELKEISPNILWDLVPYNESNNINNINNFDFDSFKENKKIMGYVFNRLNAYRDEILQERQRQAKIKEKYGLRSIEYLINELDQKLAELYDRQAMGEKVELAIKNREEEKRKYEKSKEELKREIEAEQSLSISMPELLTVIKVIPEKFDMIENEEIERIGMEIAMEYERLNGRVPEDVSKENLGFDIRSKGENEIRYIEVKARAIEGDIALTPNEWIKAHRFGDQYYLYIVANAKTNPVLYIIQNPSKNLKAKEMIEIVRFIIPVNEWKDKKIETWKK